MKKNLFVSKLLNGALIHLALISVSALIISCSSGADEIETKQPEEPKTAEMIDINLGFGGDPITISESPLSRQPHHSSEGCIFDSGFDNIAFRHFFG